MTADDFMTGSLSALRLRGVSKLGEDVDPFFARVFQEVQRSGVDCRFRIKLDPFHQYSPTLHGALSRAVGRGLLSPGRHWITMWREEAAAHLEELGKERFTAAVRAALLEGPVVQG